MFYLQVPDINVSVIDVEDSALSRLGHFATYSKLSGKQKHLQYLRNSTILDYSGFLCLRTHASLTDDNTLKEMVIEGECRLITERLNLLKPNFLRKYLIKIIDDIRLFNVMDDNLDVLLKFCSEYKDKQHVSCDEHCSIHSIEVPWQKCPTLVSNRKVHLNQGIATVPCNQWNSVLVDLFRLIYIKSLHKIRRSMSALNNNNLQIEYLKEKINGYYNSKIAFWKNIDEQISLEELTLNKILLPPCMLLSLNSLFTNHRLAHDPRYRLTLFLKDIGIPLEQTLMLFKQEYSKCGNLISTCTHSWDEHHKQIEYNVRHTYGMLGSKKNYQMTSCVLMQKQNIQVSDEGCCPFVHYSEDKLKSFLDEFTSIDDVEMNILNDLKNSDQPIQACHWYAHKLFKMSEPVYHNTPTQYFFNSKKAIS
ncbi:DNA primase large subunit-like isoform X1 [Rhopalosiphum padi]|uniref:DNA primase large subunit-like isoform X1 n=2 Tax=Rhopalosiphum padi TaxID=40932 RepID=UPI00298EC1F4|nr:DNA primase large subunit-like isoform X1 [Rhopalosiphum padi]XP_060853429.1 DNA primase large subunit-like isoform X1 [Rhopalosiphum padi]